MGIRWHTAKLGLWLLLVTASLVIASQAEQPYELWDSDREFPAVRNMPVIEGQRDLILHRGSDKYRWLHGPAVAWHKGSWHATWGNNPKTENVLGEVLRGVHSDDGWDSWSKPQTIIGGEDCAYSHGVFLNYRGKLWAFVPRFVAHAEAPGKMFPGLRMEVLTLEDSTGEWQHMGVVGQNCWPMDTPTRMPNGNWIMGCADRDLHSAVAISDGDDLTRWDTVKPMSGGSETSVIVGKNNILAIIRNQPVALVSVSQDWGRTWSAARRSNYPMVASQPFAGTLSTGQRYLIANTPDPTPKGEGCRGGRSLLTIAVSRPGGTKLCRIWKLVHGIPKDLLPGSYGGRQVSYPNAFEHDGRLYVVYTINKWHCGLSVVPVDSLSVD